MGDGEKDKPADDKGVAAQPAPLTLAIDADAYEGYFADGALSPTEKRELLLALWEIIVGFVDLGFNIHPIQQALAEKSDMPAKMAERQSAMLQLRIQSPVHSKILSGPTTISGIRMVPIVRAAPPRSVDELMLGTLRNPASTACKGCQYTTNGCILKIGVQYVG